MKVDRKLNIVIPIVDGYRTEKDATGAEQLVDNIVAYVHSAPISKQIFERYYLPLSKTFAAIYGGGLGHVAGPRVAMLLLRDSARSLGVLDGPEGVEAGLINEIKRLTMVIIPGEKGWETIPYSQAAQINLISEDDQSEVENALAFFTVVSCLHHKTVAPVMLAGAVKLWGAETLFSDSTEFANSLQTLTKVVTSPPKEQPKPPQQEASESQYVIPS